MINDVKISIITVCLNSENLIEKTIQSVINQTYSNTEYIIIDGKSTDNTLDIIEKYKSRISTLISEKDNGIYDAMNKGLRVAKGDFIYFLNSGDYFYENSVLEIVSNKINQENRYNLIYGDFIYYDRNSYEYRKGHPNITEIIARGINHQSILAPKLIFEKYGYFDIKYKIYADFDWFLKAVVKYKQKINYIGIPIAYYLKEGTSDMYCIKYRFERNEIITKYASLSQLLKYAVHFPMEFLIYLKG